MDRDKKQADNEVELLPPAGALIQSLRSIGYKFHSAIADIIDNSIAANARNVRIWVDRDQSHDYSVSILDDGKGMSFDELKSAMSLGSKSPELARDNSDLGRFGMGLKTASFSQATILTVISWESGRQATGLTWDLAQVSKTNKWKARIVSGEELEKRLTIENIPDSGTLVIWNNCDRITPPAMDPIVRQSHVSALLSDLKPLIGLIFHKFLSKKNRLDIWLNDSKIPAADPFGLKLPISTQLIFEDTVEFDGEDVITKGFLLPHKSKLPRAALQSIAPNGDFLASQGVYIYRGDRLISWGDWFRLATRNQANSLARVEISIPNTLDHSWGLDIKKSMIILPRLFRAQLKPKVAKLLGHSNRTHHGRMITPALQNDPVWNRRFDSTSNSVFYELNKSHSLVNELIESSSESGRSGIKALLNLIECTLPIDYISNDLGTDSKVSAFQTSESQLPAKVIELALQYSKAGFDRDVLFQTLKASKNFQDVNFELLDKYLDHKEHEDT